MINQRSKTLACRMILFTLLLLMTAAAAAEPGTMQEITVPNKPVKGIIRLEKQGPVLRGFTEHLDPFGNMVHTPVFDTGRLEGAVFEIRAVEDIIGKDGTLWYKANETADVIVTSGEGVTESRPLPLGHYYVIEVSAPDGYVFENRRYDVVLEAANHTEPVVTVDLTAHNDYMPTSVTLIKQKEVIIPQKDPEGMIRSSLVYEPGEGFVFGLYNKSKISYASGSLPMDSLIATAISDKNGRIRFYGSYPAGAYYVKELSCPDGWEISEERHELHLPGDAKAINNEMQIEIKTPVVNKMTHTDVRISKTDLTGSNYLPHTMIEVKNAKGEVVMRGYTGSDGYLPAFPAVPGNYTFREVLAPEGYELCTTDIAFKVNQDGTIEGKTNVADDYTRFSIRKEDQTHKPLKGVEFGLFRKDGSLQAKALTDDNGIAMFEKVPYGDYLLRETKGLSGYLKNKTEIPITVDGTFVNPKEPIAVIENCESEILIQKVDQNHHAVQGAEFGLYTEKGKLYMTAVSDAEGMVRFTGIPYGKYSIRELSAPEGYLLNHEIVYITLDDHYVNSDIPAATVINQQKKIMLIKSDTSGHPIPGVTFTLYNASTMEATETAVSDADGVLIFRNFDYGDWIIRETAAPEGYCPMEDIRLHVGEDWQEPAPILCVNIPNHFELIKTDSEGKPLAGIKFLLEDENGTELGIYESDEEGMIRITDLTPGAYFLKEISTLKGYTLSGEVVQIKLDDYYVLPEEPRRFINYTTIQTGVHMAVTGVMITGIVLMIVSGTIGLIRKRRQRNHK